MLVDLGLNLRRQLIDVGKDQSRQVVTKPALAVEIAEIRLGSLVRDPQHRQLTARFAEHLAAGQTRLVPVGVEFHLPQHESADSVADDHKHPENLAR